MGELIPKLFYKRQEQNLYHIYPLIRRFRVRPPPDRQHSFMEIDHEIFSTVILALSADSRKADVGFRRKNVHKYWSTA